MDLSNPGTEVSQLKIAIVCNRLGSSGGMERSTFELIQGLKEIGIKPIIFAKEIVLSKGEKEYLKDAIVEKVPTKWIPRILEDLYFAYRIKKKRKQFGVDILIGCCRCTGVDIVISGGTHPGFVASKKKKSFYDIVTINEEAKQYGFAKAVISHSKRTLNEIKKYFPKTPPIEKVIYPSMDIRPRDPKSLHTSRQELGIPEDRVFFLFVSSSHGRKGFGLLRKFFEETDLPVVLGVCGRDSNFTNSKNIIYLGYHNDLGPYYANADFTILPSMYEPFGRVPVESLSYGTPVLISDALGSNEVIKPECKIVFKAGDYESFYEAMKKAFAKASEYKAATNRKIKDLLVEDCEIPSLAGQARTILEIANKISQDKVSD